MTKERKFVQSYARELFRIAASDLEAAQILYKGGASRKEIIFFQVEQAIEKALKAYLVHIEKAVPLTHDLNLLVDRLPKSHQIPHIDKLDDLIEFATIRRYEEGAAVLVDAEIKEALLVGTEILNAVDAALRA